MNPWRQLSERAKQPDDTPVAQRIIDAAFPEQRDFLTRAERRRVALCSRRAGKTWADAAWLALGALEDPAGLSLYTARSKSHARMLIMEDLQDLNERFHIGIRFRELDGQLIAQFPNRHRIWLAGVKNQSECEKFRGMPFTRVVIDEAQIYGFLEYLIEDVLRPALIDKRGLLALTGTPGAVPAGLFYQVSTGDGGPAWPTSHWTLRNNPYLPDVEGEIVDVLKARGWSSDHPTFQREYLGRWVRDIGALVYPYDGQINAFSELPPGRWRYGLGVDLGAGDAASTALVLCAAQLEQPEVYALEARALANATPSRVAAEIERFRRDPARPLSLIVLDEGALGRGYGDEFRQRYGLPVMAATKQNKRAIQEGIAGDMRAGLIKIDPHKCAPLVDEMQILQWTADRSEQDPRFPDHCCDAFLYCARALRPRYDPQRDNADRMSAEMAQAIRAAKERRAKAWWQRAS